MRLPAPCRLPSAIEVSVDLPMPGEPPISTSEPGTSPPPSTRSSSLDPGRAGGRGARPRRCDAAGRAWPPPRAAGAAAAAGRLRAARRALLLHQRVPLPAARALAEPARRLGAAGGADVDGGRAGHPCDVRPAAGQVRPRPGACAADVNGSGWGGVGARARLRHARRRATLFGRRTRAPPASLPSAVDVRRARRRRALATSASRSAASSQPAEKRMKPSRHGVGAPAPAALGGRVHAAEARGLGDQRARRRGTPARAPREPRSKPTSGPAKSIWRSATLRPGGTTSTTSSRSRSSAASAAALALERSSRRPSVASERWASQASKPPAIAPERRAPAPQAPRRALGSRRRPRRAARRSGRTGSWCPRASRSRRRGRAAAGRAACRPCCRPRAARPRRGRPPPTAAMSTTSSRGFDGVSSHTSAAPSRRLGDRRVSSARAASRRRAARAAPRARPRMPG